MKSWVAFTLGGAVLAAAVIVGTVKLAGKMESPSAALSNVKLPPPLEVMPRTAWGETHNGFELHPPPQDGAIDTAWLSRGLADLPDAMAINGGTLRFTVTQPEWAVFNKHGSTYEGADEVLLTASVPDVGIGLELARIVINPHVEAKDRRWHSFEVTIPPCSKRLRLEARPGRRPESNNAYDNLWISVSEPVVFRNGVIRRRSPDIDASCPEKVMGIADECLEEKESEFAKKCGTNQVRDAYESPVGALHTGQK